MSRVERSGHSSVQPTVVLRWRVTGSHCQVTFNSRGSHSFSHFLGTDRANLESETRAQPRVFETRSLQLDLGLGSSPGGKDATASAIDERKSGSSLGKNVASVRLGSITDHTEVPVGIAIQFDRALWANLISGPTL